MQQLLQRQCFAFVATVRPDGSPDLAPQSTLAAWDDDTLVFVDTGAENTARNLLANDAIEINVIDPQLHTGCRCSGTARLLLSGPTFDRLREFYRRRGFDREPHHMVLVRVERVEPIVHHT